MSSVYTPTPTEFATSTIPDDGDSENAASVNVALEQLSDGLAYLTRGQNFHSYVWLVGGTFQMPPGLGYGFVFTLGGGGGGGGGCFPQFGNVDSYAGGGAGGGGAIGEWHVLECTPGALLTVTCGVGGPGGGNGSPATSGDSGNDGGDSHVYEGANMIARGRGAEGGQGGERCDTLAGLYSMAGGGTSARGTKTFSDQYKIKATIPDYLPTQIMPSQGGHASAISLRFATALSGGYGTSGNAHRGNGGAAGAVPVVGYHTGLGGGGGGAPSGEIDFAVLGATGGNGGNGGDAGHPAGFAGAAGTYGGGGGGGGGGNNALIGALGAAGGSGGTGIVVIAIPGPAGVKTGT